MAQVRKNRKLTTSRFSSFKRELIGLFYIVIALLFLLSIYSHDPNDPNFLNSGLTSSVNNYIGILGAYTSHIVIEFFGYFAFVLPILVFYMTYKSFNKNTHDHYLQKIMHFGFILISILTACVIFAFSGIYIFEVDADIRVGGEIGYILLSELSKYIGTSGTIVVSLLFLF